MRPTNPTSPANRFKACARHTALLATGVSCLISALDVQAAGADDCSATIREIQFEGNEITRPAYLLNWSKLRKGQAINAQVLERARQNLLDTGLYRMVDIAPGCPGDGKLVIRVTEKNYHLIYPRISRNGNGDIDTGLKYQGYNLFGTGQSLDLTLSQKDYASGSTADRIKFAYHLELQDHPYYLDWSAQAKDTLLSDTDFKLSQLETRLSFTVSRDWHNDFFRVPIRVKTKLDFQEMDLKGDQSLSELQPGQYNTLGVGVSYNDVHDHIYRRTGRYYSIEINHGFYALGSDSDNSHLLLEARFYHPLNELDNFNSRFIVAFANDQLFNLFNYAVGGADTIRGIENNSIAGNSMWLANFEYIVSSRRWPSLRTAFFTDIGRAFEDYTQVNNHDWQQTFGLGLRWKLKSYVKTDLNIDYAYAPDSGFSKIYASTSLIF